MKQYHHTYSEFTLAADATNTDNRVFSSSFIKIRRHIRRMWMMMVTVTLFSSCVSFPELLDHEGRAEFCFLNTSSAPSHHKGHPSTSTILGFIVCLKKMCIVNYTSDFKLRTFKCIFSCCVHRSEPGWGRIPLVPQRGKRRPRSKEP